VRFSSDGTLVRVGPDSRVQIDESAKERDVTLFFGRVWAHVVRAQERLSRFRSRGTIAAIRGTEFNLAVEDNGVGFTPQTLSGLKSLGLVGMRERAMACGGTLTVRGEPGEGTAIVVIIPLAAP